MKAENNISYIFICFSGCLILNIVFLKAYKFWGTAPWIHEDDASEPKELNTFKPY